MKTSRLAVILLIAATTCAIVPAQDRPDSDQPPGGDRDRRPQERQRVRPADDRGPGDSARDSRPDGDRLRPPPPQRGEDRARPERRDDAQPGAPRERARSDMGPRRFRGPDGGFRGPRFRGPDGEFGPRFHRPMPEMGPLARRVNHIERAIQHLRAAGLDGVADRLEERLHQAERSFGDVSNSPRREEAQPRPRPEPRRDEGPRETR